MLYILLYIKNIYIYTLSLKDLVVINNVSKKNIIKEINYIFLGPMFLIMCLTNIKNIGNIYYPKIGIIL